MATGFTSYQRNRQQLYTAEYTGIDTRQYKIADVSQASTAVITLEEPAILLPTAFETQYGGTNGLYSTIMINGVEGMTELATAGINGSSVFQALGPLGESLPTSQLLYSLYDAGGSGVDSSTFTAAVPNTGWLNVFSVPKFGTIDSPIAVDFTYDSPASVGDSIVSLSGEVIQINAGEGLFLVSFTFTADINVSGAVYQFYEYDGFTDTYLPVGSEVPVGIPLTRAFETGAGSLYKIYVKMTNGNPFAYPAQLTNIQFQASTEGQIVLPS